MRFNDLSLPNDPHPTFAEFYANNRIVPLTEESVASRRMSIRLREADGPASPPTARRAGRAR